MKILFIIILFFNIHNSYGQNVISECHYILQNHIQGIMENDKVHSILSIARQSDYFFGEVVIYRTYEAKIAYNYHVYDMGRIKARNIFNDSIFKNLYASNILYAVYDLYPSNRLRIKVLIFKTPTKY